MIRSLLFVFSGLVLLCASQLQQGTHYCETCGRVCVNFCNTRDFRPCCINFIRKRSSPAALAQKSSVTPELAPPTTEQENTATDWLPQTRRLNKIFKSTAQMPPSLYYLYNSSPNIAGNNALVESDV